jgi:hypothetical protein
MGRASAPLVALALLGACAGPRAQIVEDRFDISESSSAPVVTDVADLGGGDVPLAGMLPLTDAASDGIAVIGETLWIHGRSFGRQPSVVVGGRPAAVLARTQDGGILARVPPLTPAGPQPLVVANDVGRGEKTITIRRYAAALSGDAGRVAWAELTPEGPVAASVMPAAGRRLLAMSPDGRAAYLAAADRSLIDVVDVAANGAPKVVYTMDLDKQPTIVLAAAARAWTVALVRAKDVILLDVTSPLRPARSAARPLPPEVRDARIVSADLSPDGKTLAIAVDEGNRVVLLDVSVRGQAPVVATLSVAPDARESVISDVAFSPLGDTLWITTGDTDRSRASGPQPTQVHAARLEAGALQLARTVTIREAGGPDRLSTGRTIPLASGSAIRLPPERATVFVAARAAAPTGATAAAAEGAAPTSVIFRVGAEDAATAMLTEAGRFGQPDLSPDGRWLLTALIAPDGAVRLLAARADARPGAPRAIPLLGPTPRPIGRDHQLPSVRVQP